MTKLSDTEEKNAIDNITTCMFSIGFLHEITTNILNSDKNKESLIDFYASWLKNRKANNLLPISPGIILGYLYVGIVYAKENWVDLIPDTPIQKSGHEWSLYSYTPNCPKEPNPTLKYVVRRIRNSLSHGYARTIVPSTKDQKEQFENIAMEFKDINQKDFNDTFIIEIKLVDIQIFIKQFQSVIWQKIMDKK